MGVQQLGPGPQQSYISVGSSDAAHSAYEGFNLNNSPGAGVYGSGNLGVHGVGRYAISMGPQGGVNAWAPGYAGVVGEGGGYGVYGSGTAVGVVADGKRHGVDADGGQYGVFGRGGDAGVFGYSVGTTGVRGLGYREGVLGESYDDFGKPVGSGLVGVGRVGMLAFSHTDGWPGAWGRHTANGPGVVGDSPRGPGVFGNSSGPGPWGDPTQQIGVLGKSNWGYGGQFGGRRAQLRLEPGSSAGKPTALIAHQKGELYMDSTGALFVCTNSGTPGTWYRVFMTPA